MDQIIGSDVPMTSVVTESPVAGLDRRALVLGVLAVLVAVFFAGEWRSPYRYVDPRFVVDYAATELIATLLLCLATWRWFPAQALGWRWPRPTRATAHAWLPMVLLVSVTLGLWWHMRASLPAEVPADDRQALLVLRTTLLVGLNEEWLFRGLLLAAFCRWWGLRRGSVAALLAFGAFHLLNMAAGVPWQNALVQFCITFTLGAIFLMAALGTRSLLLPMLGHALYDFAVIGMATMAAPAGMAWAPFVVMGVAFVMAGWCFLALARWPQGQPYVDADADAQATPSGSP